MLKWRLQKRPATRIHAACGRAVLAFRQVVAYELASLGILEIYHNLQNPSSTTHRDLKDALRCVDAAECRRRDKSETACSVCSEAFLMIPASAKGTYNPPPCCASLQADLVHNQELSSLLPHVFIMPSSFVSAIRSFSLDWTGQKSSGKSRKGQRGAGIFCKAAEGEN